MRNVEYLSFLISIELCRKTLYNRQYQMVKGNGNEGKYIGTHRGIFQKDG